MYNLMNMQNLDTDKQDRPLNPPRIISSRVSLSAYKVLKLFLGGDKPI